MPRARFAPLLLLLIFVGAVQARASDDDLATARDDARRELMDEAVRALGREGASAIAAMKRGLAADAAFASAHAASGEADATLLAALRATLADRVLLLGDPAKGKGESLIPATDGALQEAQLLRDWLEGDLPCAVLVSDPDGEPDAAHAYDYPPVVEPKPKPAPERKPGPKDEPSKGPREAEDDKPAEPKEPAATKPQPKPEVRPETPADRLLAWAKAVRRKEGGTIAECGLAPAHCTVIPRLLAAAAAQPVYVHPDVGRLHRHALVTKDVFAYNLPHAVLRALQAEERNLAMQADRPQPSLVDSSMVREKAADAKRYKASGDIVHDLRRDVIAALDRMVDDLDGWKTQAALLAGEIVELRSTLRGGDDAAADDDASAEREARSLPLRLAQARETLATIEITLLYHTAARARARLDLLERLARAADRDTHAAEVVHQSYAEALLALRSTRRLDRLRRDRRALVRWSAPLRDPPPAAGSSAARRLAAYDTQFAVNELVQEAVRRRRAMAVGAGERDREPPAPEPPAPEDAAALVGPRLSDVIAEPTTGTWDVKYVEIAGRELLDEELRDQFNATLVAAHFAEAGGHIDDLVVADRAAHDQAELAGRFRTAFDAAETALRPLADDLLIKQVRKLPAMLSAAAGDFEAALSGISTQQVHNHERLRALVAYQELLRSQGTRSLLIRIDRSQRDPYFGDVVSDTRVALESAGAWATFEGDSHIGGFLEGAWLRILLVLASLVALIFGARLVRRLVDRWIDSMVATHPDVHASVRDERDRAHRRRARTDRAAREMTADDVLQQADVPDEDRVGETEPDADEPPRPKGEAS